MKYRNPVELQVEDIIPFYGIIKYSCRQIPFASPKIKKRNFELLSHYNAFLVGIVGGTLFIGLEKLLLQ